VHLEPARPQGGCDFKPDEAGAQDDRALSGPGARDDSAAIGQRPQRQHLRLVGARNRKSYRLGAGRQ
jgi:hypothetical protein